MDTPPPEGNGPPISPRTAVSAAPAVSAPLMTDEDWENWREWDPRTYHFVRPPPTKAPPPGRPPPTKGPPGKGAIPPTKAPPTKAPPVAAKIPSAAKIPPPPKTRMPTPPPSSTISESRLVYGRPPLVEPPHSPCISLPSSRSDSDEEHLPPSHPQHRPRMTWDIPKQGSAVSAQLGGNLTSPPPKQRPAESANLGVSAQSAAPYIYKPPGPLSAEVCELCRGCLNSFRQPPPFGLDPAGLYISLSCLALPYICRSCERALLNGHHAPAPLTVPPKPVFTRLHELWPPPPAVSAHVDRPAKGCYYPFRCFPSEPADAPPWPKPPIPQGFR